MSKKFLYLFKEGHDAFGGDQTTMKNTLGGKGAGASNIDEFHEAFDTSAGDGMWREPSERVNIW